MTGKGENGSRRKLRYRPDSDVTIELSWFGITNVGMRRENNQDAFVVAPPIFAVADGMGGHAGGEIASAAVARQLFKLGGRQQLTRDDITEQLTLAVADIAVEAGEAAMSAGTTVTGVYFGEVAEHPSWTVFNIGDSRVYQYFKGSLAQVTTDHSVVQHLVDTGAITPAEAEVHPHANVVTRAVGLNEAPIPDSVELALIPGQRILICSDGLTKELTNLGLQHYLAEAESAEAAATVLMEQALENAGRDNITLIVIEVHAVGDMRDTSDVLVELPTENDESDESDAQPDSAAEAAADAETATESPAQNTAAENS
ncbi:PP2C family protein-serine/threonine phosphatase [Canibacter zhoujuaniae]|nr:protein phosphatase 2C domain-containing protein [Canibacter zhoujuaniae]